MSTHHEPRRVGHPHMYLLGADASSGADSGAGDSSRTHAVALAETLVNVADELMDCCDGQRRMDELTQIVERVTGVAGALGTVYDHLAEWLYADGCPARHATDQFLRTADDLRMAGASCRYAQSILEEGLNQR